eukprot:g51838.t1
MFLLALLVPTLAQQYPCKAPSQFTARFTMQDQSEGLMATGVFEYDQINKVTARKFQTKTNGVVSDVFQQINTWPTAHPTRMIQYNIDVTKETCTVVRYNQFPFRYLGVLPNSTYNGNSYIGGPGENIDVIAWEERYRLGQSNKVVQEIISERGCWPIGYMVSEPKDNGELQIQVTQYYDVLGGISSNSMMVPPYYCDTSKMTTGDRNWDPHAEVTLQEAKLESKKFIEWNVAKNLKAANFVPPSSFIF